MDQIKIQSQSSPTDTWNFLITIGDNHNQTTHQVTLTKNYWQELTNEKITPEDLIKTSFEFLLEREPKESILSQFDLTVIAKYFPEFKSTIITT